MRAVAAGSALLPQGPQSCQGAPQSPQSQQPAVPVNPLPGYCPPRKASECSDGCHDRKCPPAQPTQTAPPFPAAPSPRAGPAGLGSPDSRGRRNRLGRPMSRPLSPALAAALPPLRTADSKRIQKERGGPNCQPRTTSLQWDPQNIHAPQSSRPKGDCPTPWKKKNPKTSPGGCRGDPISQAAGARPHNNFETLGQGYGNLQRDSPLPKNQFVVMEVLLLYSCTAAFPGGLARASRASSARGPARPCPGAPASRAPTLRAAGDAVARPLPRWAPPRQSTHLGRAALPAGLRRAR